MGRDKRWAVRGVLLAAVLGGGACAELHHVQMGDIDSGGGPLSPFEIKVSEVGFSQDDVANIAAGVAMASGSDKTAGGIESINAIIGLFNFGPHTGNPVFSDKYADGLWAAVIARCPSGRVTGIMAIREQRKYPVLSGEIVKLTGYCIGGAAAQ